MARELITLVFCISSVLLISQEVCVDVSYSSIAITLRCVYCMLQVTGEYVVSVHTTFYNNPGNIYVKFDHSICCCDGQNNNGCRKCDYRFVSCIIPLTETTCGPNSQTYTSEVNENSANVDFTSDMLLGLQNPLIFTGLTPTYNVSCISGRDEP